MPLVPPDFAVPAELRTERVWLRPLTIHDVVRDYDAVMSSVGHLRPAGDGWPVGLTLEQNLIDLGWHQKQFQRRDAFAYTVLDPSGERCLGCVYLDPSDDAEADVEVTLWVRASEVAGGLDAHLEAAVRAWLAAAWPFARAAFPGRDAPPAAG